MVAVGHTDTLNARGAKIRPVMNGRIDFLKCRLSFLFYDQDWLASKPGQPMLVGNEPEIMIRSPRKMALMPAVALLMRYGNDLREKGPLLTR